VLCYFAKEAKSFKKKYLSFGKLLTEKRKYGNNINRTDILILSNC